MDKEIYTVRHKGILLIGNTSQFSGEIEKLTSFKLFRQSIAGIEILTYDELYERAKYIVGNISAFKKNSEDDIDEYPF